MRSHPTSDGRTLTRALVGVLMAALGGLALVSAGCGSGGSSDNATGGNGADPILLSFTQAGQDNLALNRILKFKFSGPIDPATVGPTSIQIRQGNAFGLSVPGTFRVDGSIVTFEPRLPGLCDLTDSALQPDTEYRVTVVGFPEEFALRATVDGPHQGHPLDHTYTFQFHTRIETDPLLFDDQVPGYSPTVTGSTPANGSANVAIMHDDASTPDVYEGNEVRIQISENLQPCSIELGNTILVQEFEHGNLVTGMPAVDTTPADPFTWGGTVLPTPLTIPCTATLDQSFTSTEIVIRPLFTEWPDDALIVVELTFGITDFAGQPLVPYVLAFTTQNLPPVSSGQRELTFDKAVTTVDQNGSVVEIAPANPPIVTDLSSADMDTARAPHKAQAFLLFSGDGDNGINLLKPSKPQAPPTCTFDLQANDGQQDEFDPDNDVVLDTGSTVNTCPNQTDGSTAVIWEFRRFNIKTGRTIRIMGVNPAIILVRNDMTINSGGTLLVRGDGANGTPQGRGTVGGAGGSSYAAGVPGGTGVAGGGDGGASTTASTASNYGGDGHSGFGSPSGFQMVGGTGGGGGGVDSHANYSSFAVGASSTGGGGGGHGVAGLMGQTQIGGATVLTDNVRNFGGGTYPSGSPTIVDKLFTPSAGSGGGSGGTMEYYYNGSLYNSFLTASGGGGGAGGGFVDFTASGKIAVYGTLDAKGSNGGAGNTAGFYYGSGGGGGGSGGGVRLITPGDIDVTGGTITTAGGSGGAFSGGTGQASNPGNNGGAGGSGRIVLEDSNSLIQGIGGATLIPGEGVAGFHRDVFDASRFQSGGLKPELVTDLIFVGPRNPQYFVNPGLTDFPDTTSGPISGQGPGAGIPTPASRGLNAVAMLIEGRGYPMKADGTPDLTGQSDTFPPYYTIGFFTDSGAADLPNWLRCPTDAAFPSGDVGPRSGFTGNVGDGISNLSGNPYIQFRVTFFLPIGIHPLQPGPFLNRWLVRFTYDQ
jgi:hypothetical protein